MEIRKSFESPNCDLRFKITRNVANTCKFNYRVEVLGKNFNESLPNLAEFDGKNSENSHSINDKSADITRNFRTAADAD